MDCQQVFIIIKTASDTHLYLPDCLAFSSSLERCSDLLTALHAKFKYH